MPGTEGRGMAPGEVSQVLTQTLEIWAWPCPDLSQLGMLKLIFSCIPIGRFREIQPSDWFEYMNT